MWKVNNIDGYRTVLGAFISIVVCGGMRRSIGLIFLEVVDYCQVERSVASMMVSAFFVTSMAGSGVAAWIVRLTNTHFVITGGGLLASGALLAASFVHRIELMILLVGVVQGFGFACLYIPTIVLVTKHFKGAPGTALALCGSGSSIGAFAVPPIIAFSAERYATPGMMMILSGVSLHFVLAAAIMTPAPKEDAKECVPLVEDSPVALQTPPASDDDDDASSSVASVPAHGQLQPRKGNMLIASSVSLLHVDVIPGNASDRPKSPVLTGFRSVLSTFRNLIFYETNVSIACGTFTIGLSFFIIPPLAEDAGVDRVRQSFILFLAGGTDIVGRLVTGLLSDHQPAYRLHLYLVIMVIGAVNWAVVSVAPSFASILVFSLVSSLVGASILTILVPLIVQMLGIEVLDVSMASLDALEATLVLFMPTLLSVIRERSGTWLWGIYSGALSLVLGILICSRQFYRRLCRCRRPQD